MPQLPIRPGAATPSDLPDVLQFMQLLWAVAHGLARASKRMTAEIGVTGPQRLVLRVVDLFPGVSAGTLAAILRLHPSTLSGIFQRLVAQRLLARLDDPHDRRRAVLRLTARGRRVNAVGSRAVEAAIARALTAHSTRDRAATRRVLRRLAGCLEPPERRGRRTARRARPARHLKGVRAHA